MPHIMSHDDIARFEEDMRQTQPRAGWDGFRIAWDRVMPIADEVCRETTECLFGKRVPRTDIVLDADELVLDKHARIPYAATLPQGKVWLLTDICDELGITWTKGDGPSLPGACAVAAYVTSLACDSLGVERPVWTFGLSRESAYWVLEWRLNDRVLDVTVAASEQDDVMDGSWEPGDGPAHVRQHVSVRMRIAAGTGDALPGPWLTCPGGKRTETTSGPAPDGPEAEGGQKPANAESHEEWLQGLGDEELDALGLLRLPKDADGRTWHVGDVDDIGCVCIGLGNLMYMRTSRSDDHIVPVYAKLARHAAPTPAERLRRIADAIAGAGPGADCSGCARAIEDVAAELEAKDAD